MTDTTNEQTTPPKPPRTRRFKPDPYPNYIPQLAGRGIYAGQPKHVSTDASCQVTRSQLVNANNARLFAIQEGTRLNTFVTVVFDKLQGPNGWQRGAPPQQQVSRLRKRVLQAIGYWCASRDIPFVHITCMENKRGPGPHMHMLLHLTEDAAPAERREDGEPQVHDVTWHKYYADLQRYMDSFTGWSRAALDAERARMEARDDDDERTWLAAHVTPNHLPDAGEYRDSALNKLRYMSKGMPPHTIIQYEGKRVTAHQLAQHHGQNEPPVTLERSASAYTRTMVRASECLTIKARKAKGWTETDDLTWISRKIGIDRLKQEGVENQRLWNASKGKSVPIDAASCSSDVETMVVTAPETPDWRNEYTPCASDPDNWMLARIAHELGADPSTC